MEKITLSVLKQIAHAERIMRNIREGYERQGYTLIHDEVIEGEMKNGKNHSDDVDPQRTRKPIQ